MVLSMLRQFVPRFLVPSNFQRNPITTTTTMTNYQINTLAKTLKKHQVTETCAVLAGEHSGFSYMIENLDASNPVHAFFIANAEMTEEKFKTCSIWGAFLRSGNITKLLAFLEIPERNPSL
jgi:hypothetical protein